MQRMFLQTIRDRDGLLSRRPDDFDVVSFSSNGVNFEANLPEYLDEFLSWQESRKFATRRHILFRARDAQLPPLHTKKEFRKRSGWHPSRSHQAPAGCVHE